MAGCIISIFLIYLSVRNINFKQSFDLIKNADIYLISLSMIVFVFSYVVRTIRWNFLLLPLKKLTPMRSFYFLIFGFFMNNILPLRLGEFVRAKVAGERFQISRSGVFATVVVERLMDIIVFVICFFLIAFFVNIPVWLKNSFLLCTIIFGSMLIVLFLMSKSESKFLKIISKLHFPAKISDIVKSLFIKFATGLKFFQNTKLIIYVFITSLLVWLVEAYSYQLFFAAFGIEVSLMQSIFVIIVIGIGVIIPTAPGFIGAIEFMGIVALGIFGIEKSTAFACIASLHFCDMMVMYLLGIIGIIKEKLSFSDLFKFATIEDNNNGEKDEK
ncbi:MAG: lysylphosphatidylglycerol synthase transmembrane domain-containing protein [Endomicrobiaceae bacterium]|nr:lysylphosphatidylglycerol synthase transmembrane domain-containing protein [Endomicrobiaceae bacterium]MDD3052850.1 lysylphosphatidylglycerol synthase transmembrane domain-containing protein [Endomicrobiaceae bacterium]MDD3922635.1 lysylphosphatidylglycerol synthase transmembrane domain-containing protein [Endomicrobiaceae bacterium]